MTNLDAVVLHQVQEIAELRARLAAAEGELHKWRTGHQLGGVSAELYATLAELNDVRDAKTAAEQQLAEVRGALELAREGLTLGGYGNSDESCVACYAEGAEHEPTCCVGRALDAIDSILHAPTPRRTEEPR